MPPVALPSRILVTGASGFVGAHISRTLLARGHRVLGTVRSEGKGKFLESLYRSPNFSYAVVNDIAKKGAIDHLLENVSCVHHTASPFHFVAQDPEEIIAPAVNGTLSILNSIQEHGRDVQRVILTSSTAAIITPKETPHTFNEDEWNTYSPAEIERLGRAASESDKYQASKVLAERAAWQFVEDGQRNGKISWDLVTLCPPFIFGPVIHDVDKAENLNTSMAMFRSWMAQVPPKEQATAPFLNLVDVRDVANAHALAMENGAAGGHRFIISNGPFSIQDIYDELRAANIADTPRGYPGYAPAKETQHVHDGSKAVRMLGLEMTPRPQMVSDALASLRQRW